MDATDDGARAVGAAVEPVDADVLRSVGRRHLGDTWVTALHRIAWNGEIPRVRLLLQAGADATIREDTYGATAAGRAGHAGHRDVARRLEDALRP